MPSCFCVEALTDYVFFQEGPGLRKWQWTDDGIKVINGRNLLIDGQIDLNNTDRYISQLEFENNYSHFAVEIGDIVVTSSGTIGKVARIRDGHLPLMMNTSVIRFHPLDSEVLDPDYLFTFLRSRFFQQQAHSFAVGAAQLNFGPVHINQMKIVVPPIEQQRSIARVVTAYDDLIENNRRRIQLLEASARLLYKEWFVRLRFPGHEHVTIIDGVPDGWGRKKIADVCETVGGGTPSTKVYEYWDGDVTWIVPSDVTKNDSLALLDSERKITEKGLRESSAKMVPADTILMTSRASVGFFALMDFEVCTNQGFINVIPHNEEARLYLLFNLMSRANEIRSNAKGTTYPEISKGRFRRMDVVLPPASLTTQFAKITGGIIQQVRCLKRSVQQLTKARDLLLPRLMNGKVAL